MSDFWIVFNYSSHVVNYLIQGRSQGAEVAIASPFIRKNVLIVVHKIMTPYFTQTHFIVNKDC